KRAHGGDQPEAVLAGRHPEIGHEDIGRRRGECGEACAGRVGGDDVGTAFDEEITQGRADQLVVVDEQQTHSGQGCRTHDAGPPGHSSRGSAAQATDPLVLRQPGYLRSIPRPVALRPSLATGLPLSERGPHMDRATTEPQSYMVVATST